MVGRVTETLIEESIENRKIISVESDYKRWELTDEAMRAIEIDRSK